MAEVRRTASESRMGNLFMRWFDGEIFYNEERFYFLLLRLTNGFCFAEMPSGNGTLKKWL